MIWSVVRIEEVKGFFGGKSIGYKLTHCPNLNANPFEILATVLLYKLLRHKYLFIDAFYVYTACKWLN
jgi:hypothetical protein